MKEDVSDKIFIFSNSRMLPDVKFLFSQLGVERHNSSQENKYKYGYNKVSKLRILMHSNQLKYILLERDPNAVARCIFQTKKADGLSINELKYWNT